MSRRKKSKRQHASDTIPQKTTRAPISLIISVLITLILGGIPFGLGKYIELNSPGPFDSGAYVYSAKHLLDGAKMGVDEQSSARPGTLLMNVIGVRLFGFSDNGPKIVQMVLQLSALIFLFATVRKVFGPVASVVSTTVAAIYLSAPLIAKFGNVKEQFMIPFMIAAACSYLMHKYSQKRYWLILAGFFAVQPYFFKPTGLSILAALGAYLILENLLLRKWKNLVLEAGFFLSGYMVGLLVPGLLYFWQDSLEKLLTSLPVVLVEAGLVFSLLIAGIVGLIVLLKRFRILSRLRQVSIWIWIAGLFLAVAALAIGIMIVKQEAGSDNSDILSYIQDIPFIKLPLQLKIKIQIQINNVLSAAGIEGGYVSESWSATEMSTLAPRIYRYYKALSVPILLAVVSVITAACVFIAKILKKINQLDLQSKLVWMLAGWWLLDMIFVWGSPRSYEQYYLPLCGSAAVLSGYAVWKWQTWFTQSRNKMPALASGIAAVIVFGALSTPIFIGQRFSPDTGADYLENPRYGKRQRGFGPSLRELPGRKKGAWIAAGDYIRTHTTDEDTIYVWGWYPGIYVQAQRLAPVPKAFEANMHVTPPNKLKGSIRFMVGRMKENPPKFIVDSRKLHFPNDRPPLELWPIVTDKSRKIRPLNNNPKEITTFESYYTNKLEKEIGKDEAERFQAMKPFREFVMNNYRLVKQCGVHMIFKRIEPQNTEAP